MSLRIEQRLDKNSFTESEPRIFTTGAFLVPMEITRDGIKRYLWIVDKFADDTYNDGIICSPNVYANSRNGLLES